MLIPLHNLLLVMTDRLKLLRYSIKQTPMIHKSALVSGIDFFTLVVYSFVDH